MTTRSTWTLVGEDKRRARRMKRSVSSTICKFFDFYARGWLKKAITFGIVFTISLAYALVNDLALGRPEEIVRNVKCSKQPGNIPGFIPVPVILRRAFAVVNRQQRRRLVEIDQPEQLFGNRIGSMRGDRLV